MLIGARLRDSRRLDSNRRRLHCEGVFYTRQERFWSVEARRGNDMRRRNVAPQNRRKKGLAVQVQDKTRIAVRSRELLDVVGIGALWADRLRHETNPRDGEPLSPHVPLDGSDGT